MQKNERKLLLAVIETHGDKIIATEKVFYASDIKAFKDLPEDIYKAIESLVKEQNSKIKLQTLIEDQIKPIEI